MTPIQSVGEAMPSPFQASDLVAEYSKLLTLIDITMELVGDISAADSSPAEKGLIFNAQNMSDVMWDLAHRFEDQLGAYIQQQRRQSPPSNIGKRP